MTVAGLKVLRVLVVGAACVLASAGVALARGDDVALTLQHNLDAVNAYRAQAGAPPLLLDAKLNAFAQAGAEELRKTHEAHGHFKHADAWSSGFTGGAAENQGDPNGWPIRVGLNATIDDILKFMMAEGPGGGHHDNMLNPKMRRLGVGVVRDSDKLYFTDDFSQ